MQGTNLPPGIPGAGDPPNMSGIPGGGAPAPAPAPAPLPPGVPAAGAPVAPVAPAPAPVTPAKAPAVPVVAPAGTDPVSIVANLAGLSADDLARVMANAKAYGDPALLDVAFLQEKAGDKAAMLLPLLQQQIAQEQAATQQKIADVYAMAGSKEAWDSQVGIFNAKAPDTLRNTVAFLFDNGQDKGAAELLLSFVKSAGLAPAGYTGTPGVAAPAANGFTREQFQAAMQELQKSVGNRSLESPDVYPKYQALLERRALGRSMGL